MTDFAQQVQAFTAKALANIDSVVQSVTTSVAGSLVEKSPVDTGALRANWQFTAGAPAAGTLPSVFDLSGAATITALADAIKSVKAGGITYVVNNLPYAPVIEYGLYPNPPKHPTGKTEGGFSTQAPNGMRDITVLEFPRYVQQAVQNL